MSGLLDDTADWWKSRGVQIRHWYSDDTGRYAFRVTVQFSPAGQTHDFIVSARSSMRSPLGAMKSLIAMCHGKDTLLVLRAADSGQYVFNPETILKHGTERTTEDRRSARGEQWIDFRPDWGCSLEAFADGLESPTSPQADPVPVTARSDGSDRNTLDDYGQ